MRIFQFCEAVPLALLVCFVAAAPITSECETPSCNVKVDDIAGYFDIADLAEITKLYYQPNEIFSKDDTSHSLRYEGNITIDATQDTKKIERRISPPKPATEIRNMSQFPWRTTGRVISHDMRTDEFMLCTGTLVGPNVIVTASHCVPWDQPFKHFDVEFIPGYSRRKAPYGHPRIQRWRGLMVTADTPRSIRNGYDYVICKLDKAVGNHVGWMGFKEWSSSEYLNQTWTAVGYPYKEKEGTRPFVHKDIGIGAVLTYERGGKRFDSYPYASRGWSGGPLFQDFRNPDQAIIAGVISTERTSNGGPQLGRLIAWALKNW